MAEYIKLDVALKALCQVSAPTPSESYIVEKCIEKINGLPMIEVMRCKDCKHCKKHPTSDRVKMCTNEQQWVTECYPLVHDNDFCSYGERRKE